MVPAKHHYPSAISDCFSTKLHPHPPLACFKIGNQGMTDSEGFASQRRDVVTQVFRFCFHRVFCSPVTGTPSISPWRSNRNSFQVRDYLTTIEISLVEPFARYPARQAGDDARRHALLREKSEAHSLPGIVLKRHQIDALVDLE